MGTIPPPTCPFGYTEEDLHKLFPTEEEMAAFNKWMYGQTIATCEGRTYNHEEGVYEATTCADHPHGLIVYIWDLKRYLNGAHP